MWLLETMTVASQVHSYSQADIDHCRLSIATDSPNRSYARNFTLGEAHSCKRGSVFHRLDLVATNSNLAQLPPQNLSTF